MSGPRIILADHRRLFRTAAADALGDNGVQVLACVDDVSSAMLQVQRLRPDVVAMAHQLPGGRQQLVPELRQLDDRPRILLIDDADGADAGANLLAAIEAGADGYVTGRGGLTGLVDALRQLADGQSVVPPDLLGPLLRQLIERRREAAAAYERLMLLTPREREILALLADGLDQDAIAQTLVISPATARTHIQRVLRKLGVHSRLEAVTLTAQHGLVDRLERAIERTNA